MSGYFTNARGKLNKLRDVDVAGLADADTLVWDEAQKKWVPGTASGGSTAAADTYQYTQWGF